jgi:hypothetical protein
MFPLHRKGVYNAMPLEAKSALIFLLHKQGAALLYQWGAAAGNVSLQACPDLRYA